MRRYTYVRRLAAISVPCLLLLAACTSPETVVVAAGGADGEQVSADGSAESAPPTIAANTMTTVPHDVFDPSDYLLTQDDVPGWKYVRKMN
ncbi:MAG: hypothetical protein ACN4GZ_10295, partial [Acidimicrobiales bacterium]